MKFVSVDKRIYVSLSKNMYSVLTGASSGGEERERENFLKIISLGKFSTFFDVGANVGFYSFMFKTLVPNGQVIMFEPDISNCKLLKKSISKSRIHNIELIEAAASDSTGEIYFYIDEVSGATGATENREQAMSFVQEHHGVAPRKTVVNAVTLDDISEKNFDPELIKIDVEGAEMSVFTGAFALMKRSSPAIFFECDSHNTEIMKILQDNGYMLFDFESLKTTAKLCHNNLALHHSKHKAIISALN